MAIHWHSFHLYFQREVDRFLAHFLGPGLQKLGDEGRLKRVFFIRYSEGGYHLRLRLAGSMSESSLRGWLEETVARFRVAYPDAVSRIAPVGYDRSRDYFGETADTVYSELINVATTGVVLALLVSNGPMTRSQMLLVTLAALDWWLRHTVADPERRRAFATRSRIFAEHVLFRHQEQQSSQPFHSSYDLLRSYRHCRQELFPRFDRNDDFHRAALASRRLLAQKRTADGVFHHSMHLLCNKLGLSIADERFLFSLLEKPL